MRVFITILVFNFLWLPLAIAKDIGKCTPIHKEPVAVFINPTDEEIAAMKKEHGEEDFYIVADDAMYYDWQAGEFLKKLNIPTCSTKNESHRFITKDGKEYHMDRKCDSWCLILWNGSEAPVFANAIDISMYEPYLKGEE